MIIKDIVEAKEDFEKWRCEEFAGVGIPIHWNEEDIKIFCQNFAEGNYKWKR